MKNTVTIVLGYPAAGKTTVAGHLIKAGAKQLSRDIAGSKRVTDLLPKLEEHLKEGHDVVLDNLFTRAEDRAPFIKLAKKLKAKVNCIWVKTSIEDAQINACYRMIQRYGKILTPEELKSHKDPNMFPPAVLFRYRKMFESPKKDEGFNHIEEKPFVRGRKNGYDNKALILDYDETLRTAGNKNYPTEIGEVKILPNRSKILKSYKKKGYKLLGASNQSGIAKGELTAEMAREIFEHTNGLLGVKIDYQFCSHNIPPVKCFCRKPQVGMGIYFTEKYKLNPSEVIMVGDMKSDETFAARCGFQFVYANEFFK